MYRLELYVPFAFQVPDSHGPVRTLAEGKPDELFVGTTRNAVLRGSFSGSLTPIVQVYKIFLENLQNQDVCYVMESCHSYSSVFVFF